MSKRSWHNSRVLASNTRYLLLVFTMTCTFTCCNNSGALAMELLQSCAKPSLYCQTKAYTLLNVHMYWTTRRHETCSNKTSSQQGSFSINLNAVFKWKVCISYTFGGFFVTSPWLFSFRQTPIMMTSSNGNIFRITGHLCGKFTGPRWIPRTKASDAELWCFLWSSSE